MVGGRTVALVAVLSGGPLAEAAPQENGAGGAPRPERVAVVVYGGGGLSEPLRRDLEDSLAAGIRRAAAREVALEARAGTERDIETPDPAVLEEADRILEEARRQVRELEIERAETLLEQAAGAYAAALPELLVRDRRPERLVDALVELAIVRYLSGEEAAASGALVRAMVMDPSLEYSPRRFPPRLKAFVEETRRAFDARERGGLQISVRDSPEAEIYVNGERRGGARAEALDLPAGPNYVLMRAPGYLAEVIEATVPEGKTVPLETALEPAPGRVRGPFAGTASEVGSKRLARPLAAAAAEASADGLVLVMTEGGKGKLRLVVYVYDARRGRLLGRVRGEVAREGPEPGVRELARTVWARSGWGDMVEGGTEAEPGALGWIGGRWQRARNSRFFWPTIGVALGAGALGVTYFAHTRGLSTERKVILLPLIRSF